MSGSSRKPNRFTRAPEASISRMDRLRVYLLSEGQTDAWQRLPEASIEDRARLLKAAMTIAEEIEGVRVILERSLSTGGRN